MKEKEKTKVSAKVFRGCYTYCVFNSLFILSPVALCVHNVARYICSSRLYKSGNHTSHVVIDPPLPVICMYAHFVCLSYSAHARVSLSTNLTHITMRQRLLPCFIYSFASKDIFKRYRVFNRLKWTWSYNAWHTFCLLVVQNPSLLAHDHGHYCAEIRICTRLPNKAML